MSISIVRGAMGSRRAQVGVLWRARVRLEALARGRRRRRRMGIVMCILVVGVGVWCVDVVVCVGEEEGREVWVYVEIGR